MCVTMVITVCRKTAIALMADALDQYVVRGLGNNLCFLSSIMRNKNFRDGKYGTKFIPLEYPKGFKGELLNDNESKELIASAVVLHTHKYVYELHVVHE